jgi:hypothetical protein
VPSTKSSPDDAGRLPPGRPVVLRGGFATRRNGDIESGPSETDEGGSVGLLLAVLAVIIILAVLPRAPSLLASAM